MPRSHYGLFFFFKLKSWGAWFRITHGKIGLWRRLKARRRCPQCREEQNIIEILLKCSEMWKWSTAHPRVGAAAQKPPPQAQIKTTGFVDLLTSRFYMIYASAQISHWNQLNWNTGKYNNNLQTYIYIHLFFFFSFNFLCKPSRCQLGDFYMIFIT